MATIKILPTSYTRESNQLYVSNGSNLYTDTSSDTYARITHTKESSVFDFFIHGFETNKIPEGVRVTNYSVKIKINSARSGITPSTGIFLCHSTSSPVWNSSSSSYSAFSDTGILKSNKIPSSPDIYTFPTDSISWSTLNQYIQDGSFGICVPVVSDDFYVGGGIDIYGAEIEVTYDPPKKYVSDTKLQYFWNKLKAYFSTLLSSSIANWNETDSTALSYIQNKPFIKAGDGTNSIKENYDNTVTGDYAHAEGYETTASGAASHAEGENTTASAEGSHAEGYNTTASALYAHVEGNETIASKAMAHAEGYRTTASGQISHAEGRGSIASGNNSHAEGYGSVASNGPTHAEGYSTSASGYAAHAEGFGPVSQGRGSHAEGYNTMASGQYAHAEGFFTTASTHGSHSEGYGNIIDLRLTGEANTLVYTYTDTMPFGVVNHLQNNGVIKLTKTANGPWDWNYNQNISGTYSYVNVTAIDTENKTITVDQSLFTEAISNRVCWFILYNTASGVGSHSEGISTIASGQDSHATGIYTVANNMQAIATGEYTIASTRSQTVLGSFNIPDDTTNNSHPSQFDNFGQYAVIVGNGYENTTTKEVIRSNAHTLDWQGNGWYAGKLTVGSAPTENLDVATKQYVDSSVMNADWLENDSTSNAYIENRTHYTEDPVTTEVFTYSNEENSAYYSIQLTNADLDWVNSLEEGSAYTIVLNGTTYTGNIASFNTWGAQVYVMGNVSMMGLEGAEDTGEPFVFSIVPSNGEVGLNVQNAPTSGISLSLSMATAVVHKLDSKYLNGSLIKSGQGFNSEIFNGLEKSTYPIGIAISGEANVTIYDFICFDKTLLDNKFWSYITVENHETIKVLTFTDIDYSKENGYWFGHIQFSETLNAENGFTEEEIILLIPTNDALGIYSHAEGYNIIALGNYSHAEGRDSKTSGAVSHAEGSLTIASGNYSHAEGQITMASGASSHAEGENSQSTAWASHAEGGNTIASGDCSHAEGRSTTAQRRSQHVFGEYNILDTNGTKTTRGNYVEIVGNGTLESARSNARTLDWFGNEVLAGKLTVGTGPTANMDVATKQYVDAATAGITTNLSGLTDTTISSPINGQILVYDSATSKWINSTASFVTASQVNTLIQTALAAYGDGDTATYGTSS